MWNRRKVEDYMPKAAPTPPTSVELAKEGIPMSTLPHRAAEPNMEASRGAAVLGKSVSVKGQIFSREDLTIDGQVDGTVEMQEHRLTVGPNGKVVAGVKAREVVVLGTVHGNVEVADRIEIRKDAKLVGDIKTARIVIEDGAYFKGSIDIVKLEVSRQAPPKPVAVPAAPPIAGTSTSSAAAGASEIKR